MEKEGNLGSCSAIGFNSKSTVSITNEHQGY